MIGTIIFLMNKYSMLPKISSEDCLTAVFSDIEEQEDKKKKPSKKDFEYTKMIGKGGFSNVFEGMY